MDNLPNNNDHRLVVKLPNGMMAHNLYKLHPPFRKLKQGHGFIGVVLADKKTGEIQCHICGKLFDTLSHHLRKHKINVQSYKEIYGLRKNKDKLMSKKMIDIFKRAAEQRHKKAPDHLSQNLLKSLETRKENKRSCAINCSIGVTKGSNSMAHLNEVGLCPDQINSRFDIVANLIGRQPGWTDLRQYDTPLLIKIMREHGTLNNYRELRGLSPVRRGQSPIDNIALIVAIRKLYFKKGRICARDFQGSNGTISWRTIRERFGSLRTACWAAGIDSETWTMVG